MSATRPVFGPLKPSKLALMGVRFVEGEEGASPTPPKPAPPAAPAAPTEPEPTDWKSESRKWEARAKENAAAAQRLTELEEAQKTELQKANDRAAAAEKAAADAAASLADRDRTDAERKLRDQVAADKKVPAALLTGSTKEELEASADELLAFQSSGIPTPPARFVVADEGGRPDLTAKDTNSRPGIGTLRAAYAQQEGK